MNFQDYRKKRGLSRAKVGAALGVDGLTVWRWETRRSIPKPDTILKIIAWSSGEVTANELLGAPVIEQGAAV